MWCNPAQEAVSATQVLWSVSCRSADLVGRAGALASFNGDGALDEWHLVILDEKQVQAIRESDLQCSAANSTDYAW